VEVGPTAPFPGGYCSSNCKQLNHSEVAQDLQKLPQHGVECNFVQQLFHREWCEAFAPPQIEAIYRLAFEEDQHRLDNVRYKVDSKHWTSMATKKELDDGEATMSSCWQLFHGARLTCAGASGVNGNPGKPVTGLSPHVALWPCDDPQCDVCNILKTRRFQPLSITKDEAQKQINGDGICFHRRSSGAKGMFVAKGGWTDFANVDAGNAVFVANVFIGDAEFVDGRSTRATPGKPAAPKDARIRHNTHSKVGNDEITVWDSSQAVPQYLILFGSSASALPAVTDTNMFGNRLYSLKELRPGVVPQTSHQYNTGLDQYTLCHAAFSSFSRVCSAPLPQILRIYDAEACMLDFGTDKTPCVSAMSKHVTYCEDRQSSMGVGSTRKGCKAPGNQQIRFSDVQFKCQLNHGRVCNEASCEGCKVLKFGFQGACVTVRLDKGAVANPNKAGALAKMKNGVPHKTFDCPQAALATMTHQKVIIMVNVCLGNLESSPAAATPSTGYDSIEISNREIHVFKDEAMSLLRVFVLQ
jgi:hypothetical protein